MRPRFGMLLALLPAAAHAALRCAPVPVGRLRPFLAWMSERMAVRVIMTGDTAAADRCTAPSRCPHADGETSPDCKAFPGPGGAGGVALCGLALCGLALCGGGAETARIMAEDLITFMPEVGAPPWPEPAA